MRTGTSTVWGAEHVEREQHGVGEGGGLLFAGEVEAIDLASVTPLVEGGGGLVVLQTLHNGVVYHHLRQRKTTVRENETSSTNVFFCFFLPEPNSG